MKHLIYKESLGYFTFFEHSKFWVILNYFKQNEDFFIIKSNRLQIYLTTFFKKMTKIIIKKYIQIHKFPIYNNKPISLLLHLLVGSTTMLSVISFSHLPIKSFGNISWYNSFFLIFEFSIYIWFLIILPLTREHHFDDFGIKDGDHVCSRLLLWCVIEYVIVLSFELSCGRIELV